MKNTSKKYDVVILTHEPKDELLLSIENLQKQKNKPNKIILYNTDKKIFDKNISDKKLFKKKINSKDIIVKHIEKKNFDHGKARNDAIKYCISPYVLFMTDDAIPYDDKMTIELLKSFDDKKVAVAYARQIAKKNAKLKEKYTREFNYPEKDIIKDKSTEKELGIKNCFCSNSCAMYDRKIFLRLGKFDTKLSQNEDMLYAYKAIEKNYKIAYRSKAKVYHSHDFSYLEQFKRNQDIGKFQKQYDYIYSKYKSEGEGMKLVKYVNCKLLKSGNIIDAIDFDIECIFRYAGFLIGKRGPLRGLPMPTTWRFIRRG